MINYTPSIPDQTTPGFLGWHMDLAKHQAAIAEFASVAKGGRMPSPEVIAGLIDGICHFEQDPERREQLRTQLLSEASAEDIAQALQLIAGLKP